MALELDGVLIDANNISDNYTINADCGRVWITAGEAICWVNNDRVTAASLLFANLETVDQTAKSAFISEAAAGSFVVRLDHPATDPVSIGFLVVTPIL